MLKHKTSYLVQITLYQRKNASFPYFQVALARIPPLMCYLLKTIRTPLFPAVASSSTPPSFPPCSLTLGANSCSLINY